MTVDPGSAATITAMVLKSQNLLSDTASGAILPFGNFNGANKTHSRSIMGTILDLIAENLPGPKNYQAMAEGSEQSDCPGGGGMNLSMTWDGPDETDDNCAIENLQGTIALEDCVEGGLQRNGTITFSLDGPLCAPTAMAFTLTDYSANSSSDWIETRDLRLAATLITWEGNFPVTDPTHMNLTANGQLVANVNGADLAVAFSNYTQRDSSAGFVFSGNITGPCVDGWADLTTQASVQSVSLGCPLSGQMTISGADYASAIVNFDSSDAITINAGNSQGIDCDQLLALECSAP